MAWYRWQGNDLLLHIKVQPGASRSQIAGLHGEQLKIRIQAPPVDGRANETLIAYLSECFALGKTNVQIEHGHNARNKQVRIRNPQQLPTELVALGLTPTPT